MHVADGLPVSDVATPTLGVLCFGVSVDLLTTRQDVRVTPRAARYPHLALDICRAPRYGVRHGNPKPRQAYAEYARGA